MGGITNRTISSILLLLATLFLLGLTSAEKAEIKACQKDCSTNQRAELLDCRSEANTCIASCKDNYAECIDVVSDDYTTCKASCTTNECLRSCTTEQRTAKKACSLSECTATCLSDRKTCTDLANSVYKSCPHSCKQLNTTVMCGNQTPGTIFFQGCNTCACTYSGEVKCVTTPLCHFSDTWVPKDDCTTDGGLYQQLCNGPYFDIVCSQSNYCLCAGNDEYSCPAEFTCVTDFTFKPPRTQTVGGWKDLLGRELGDIGICARN